MNKKKKQMKIMLIVLVIVAVAIAGIVIYQKQQSAKESAAEQEKVLAEINVEDVTAFSYYLDGEQLSFTKQDDTWVYDNDASLSIDTDKVESMLENAATVSYSAIVEDPEELSSYGLDSPSNVIVISTADDTYTFTIGDTNSITSELYMMFGSDTTVYTMSTDLTDAFSKSVDDLLEDASE